MRAFPRIVLMAVLPLGANFFQCQGKPKAAAPHFDAPAGIAIGPAGDAIPPDLYAFVADPGHFAVRRIDLQHRRLIEPRFPVGRALGALVPHVGAAGAVDKLWGVDAEHGALVTIDPAVALAPTVTPPVGGPSCCTIEGLRIESGLTSTQTWTVRYRSGLDRWEVTGSGSGVQKKFARTGSAYTTDQNEVTFVIRRGAGAPQEGDTFTFSTNNGVQVAAVTTTGSAVNLVSIGGATGLLVTDVPPSIVAFDLATGAAQQTFGLPAGAIPAALEVVPDGSAAYLSDLGNAVVYRLDTAGPVAGWTLESFAAPVSMRDLAVTGDGARLLAMAEGADDIFVYALPDMLPVDFNADLPGFDPFAIPTAIRTLGAARAVHGSRGTGLPGYPVLLATHAGNLFVINGGTGCVDFDGPNGAHLSGARFRDSALTSAPRLRTDLFHANRCGGVAHSETWTFTFDGVIHAWRVKGSFSGDQVALLTENVPYTTDRGDFTIEIDADATLPTDDGDAWFVTVADGIAPIPVGLVPSKPVFFSLPPDATGRVFERALVPNAASDTVSEIDLDTRRVITTYR